MLKVKRYFSTSQVDGRRLAMVLMVTNGRQYATFSRETDKERKRWANSGVLRGKRYTVNMQGTTVCHTDAFSVALAEFAKCARVVRQEQ